jgi:hypothetical protein
MQQRVLEAILRRMLGVILRRMMEACLWRMLVLRETLQIFECVNP